MIKQTPIVGILSGTHKNHAFSGDQQFFESIQRECIKHGSISFVFTPFGIQSETIEGFIFENGTWKQKIFPYPQFVYNRIPAHTLENSRQVQTFFHTLEKRNIPFFNRQFIDKWSAYTLLKSVNNENIQLPKTELLTDTEAAIRFLKTYTYVYVKPIHGKIGKGIFTLTYNNDGDIMLTTHTQTKIVTASYIRRLFSFILRHYREPYILQQGIILDEIDEQKYDFRILLLKVQSEWDVIGIGVRAANKGKITTHTVRGGTILPLQSVTSAHDIEKLTTIAKQIASEFAKKDDTLRECSLDIGKDRSGNYWFFEINTKPMTFNERDIESKRISKLVKTFLEAINSPYI